jgi:hypothetical protein
LNTKVPVTFIGTVKLAIVGVDVEIVITTVDVAGPIRG